MVSEVQLAEAGDYTLSVKPKTMPHGVLMNLQAATLKPQ